METNGWLSRSCSNGTRTKLIRAAAAVFLLQLLHGCSGEILFHEIPTLVVGQSIRTEEKGEQLNLLLEDTFVRVQYKIMIFVGIRQLLQKFRVIEPYMHARRTASLDAERQAVEHGKKVEQHIQIGERSAIEQQAVALLPAIRWANSF